MSMRFRRYRASDCAPSVVARTAFLFVLLLVSGCSEPEEVQTEPKRADDLLTAADLESFLSIVHSLADQKAPAMPAVILPPPQWSRNRSLPVSELVNEDEKTRTERASIEWLSAHCPRSRFLMRALRREKMTIEQFVGLYLALAMSLYRDSVPADRDLDAVLVRGKQTIADMKKDQRTFSGLAEELAKYLQEQSGWL